MVIKSTKWIVVLATCLLDLVSSVKITNMQVQENSDSKTASLNCQYDLEGQPLHDVTWYKDGRPFHVCLASGSTQSFDVEGVKIQISIGQVNSCPVTLVELSEKTSGKYTCEVTLGPPLSKATSNSVLLNVSNTPSPPYNSPYYPPAPPPPPPPPTPRRSMARKNSMTSPFFLLFTTTFLYVTSKL